jgi:hypothetical protein
MSLEAAIWCLGDADAKVRRDTGLRKKSAESERPRQALRSRETAGRSDNSPLSLFGRAAKCQRQSSGKPIEEPLKGSKRQEPQPKPGRENPENAATEEPSLPAVECHELT